VQIGNEQLSRDMYLRNKQTISRVNEEYILILYTTALLTYLIRISDQFCSARFNVDYNIYVY